MAVSIGSKIAAGTIATLISAINAEFDRRANPYNKNRLDTINVAG
jgi:hypothetical protein